MSAQQRSSYNIIQTVASGYSSYVGLQIRTEFFEPKHKISIACYLELLLNSKFATFL
jgi:hypothetical protein